LGAKKFDRFETKFRKKNGNDVKKEKNFSLVLVKYRGEKGKGGGREHQPEN